MIDRGHSIISSPKCHPELAGDGVEYGWGHSKKCYRKSNTGNEKEMRAKQRERVFDSISPTHLPKMRLMKFSRKAREYKLVYYAEDKGKAEFSHKSIETGRHAHKLKRTHNSHRGISTAVLTNLTNKV